MKTIKDLTEEQAIILCKLTWGFPDSVVSEYKFNYFDGNYGLWKNENEAIVSVSFDYKNDSYSGKVMHMIFNIYPNLDCSIGEFKFIPYETQESNEKRGYWNHEHSYPVCNQNMVQGKLNEWEIKGTSLELSSARGK